MDKFGVENKTRTESEIATDFYIRVWCYGIGYTPSNPWILNNTTEVQTMEDAAILFAEYYDVKDKYFANNSKAIIYVQDWRGRIAKFNIRVVYQPEYYARRIK